MGGGVGVVPKVRGQRMDVYVSEGQEESSGDDGGGGCTATPMLSMP